MRIIITALLAFCSLLCRAEERPDLLVQAKTALETYAPTSRFHDYAIDFGDVNNDGLTDFVTFLGAPQYNDNGVENLKAVVFLGARGNTFTFFEESSDIQGHARVSNGLEIENQSIVLRREGVGWVEKFQFKMRYGRLALVGLEDSKFGPDAGKDAGTSANLLTGRVIRWTGSGKSRREKKSSVPALGPVPFKDFDYASFSHKWSVLW